MATQFEEPKETGQPQHLEEPDHEEPIAGIQRGLEAVEAGRTRLVEAERGVRPTIPIPHEQKGNMNSVHTTFVGIVFFGVTPLLPLPSFPNGQSAKCSDLDLVAVLQPTDKAYSMAMELAQRLQSKDFIIKCVLRSKMEGFFEELEGAALFRTNRGDFEALFLPKPKTFERLGILENQENGRYIYSFEGDPKPLPFTGINSSRRVYFVKHAHMLLEMSDDALANDLRRAVTGQ